MKLIVGLGNPGKKYELTRHNIGFLVVDYLSEKLNAQFSINKHKALIAEALYEGEKVLLVKPQTFMNLSGEAVQAIANFYKIEAKDIAVVHDDKDLDIGRLRIRKKGSSGGQRGVANIINLLGTEEFARVKLGVGKPPANWDTADYVLSVFKNEEWEIIKDAIIKATDACLALCNEQVDLVMNQYNS
jgi:PTH1 family peptidyl-tRNA hydrolase